MKKKIAFLMAAVMAFAAVPAMSLSAAASLSVGGHEDLPEKSLILPVYSGAKTIGGDAKVGDGRDVDYVKPAASITIRPSLTGASSEIKQNTQFRVALTDAKIMFANANAELQAAIGNALTFPLYDANAATNDANRLAAQADVAAIAAIVDYIEAAQTAITGVTSPVDATGATTINDLYATGGAMADATAKVTTINNAALKTAAAAIVDTALAIDGTDLADAYQVGDTTTALAGKFTAALATGGAAGTVGALEATAAANLAAIPPSGSTTGFEPGTASNGEYKNLSYYVNGVKHLEIEVLSDSNEAQVKVVAPDGTYDYANPLTLEFPMWLEDAKEASVRITDQIPTTVISTGSHKINTINKNAGTNVTISDVNSGRTSVELGKITVAETTANIIKNGLLQIKLTSGYVFTNVNAATISAETGLVMSTTGLTLQTSTTTGNAYLSDNGRTLIIKIAGLTSTGTRGKLFIEKLSVAPEDDDSENYGTVKAEFKGIDKFVSSENKSGGDPVVSWVAPSGNLNSGIKEQKDIEIAKFVDYGVTLEFADKDKAKVTEAYSGKAGIEAGKKDDDVAEIKLAETAAVSWWSERDTVLTLTDADGNVLSGVKFNSFEIVDTGDTKFTDKSLHNTVPTGSTTGSQVAFRRDRVTLKAPTAIDRTKTGAIKFEITFNTAANFAGDVYLNVKGSGDNLKDSLRLKVATITAPITVKTGKTNVAIGYQSYAVSDITVTENAKGVLKRDRTVDLTVREFANYAFGTETDVYFNPVKSDTVKVTAGNLGINKLELASSGARLQAHINRESTEASTFTLSGLQVKILRSAPYGTYDLVVGGEAWVETFDKDADEKSPKFKVEGLVVTGYVDITTPGTEQTVSRNIEIVEGSTTAIVDGKEMAMPVATYIDPASNRTMLPLRAVSNLFGINDDNVIWTASEGTATIIVGTRIVTFKEGSSKMTISGVSVDMVDENGVAVKAVINPENGRTYIPLRQLGIAFGIDVLWIPSNPGVAVFNPTQAQKDAATTATSAPAASTDTDTEAETPAETTEDNTAE